MNNKIAIISPCYNEEESILLSVDKLISVMNNLKSINKISKDSFILIVDDGSTDRSWNLIQQLSKKHNGAVKGIRLDKNYGQQNALLTGIKYCCNKVDATITMDIDLQDDINCIEKMLDEYNNNYEVVYGVKQNRKNDNIAKRVTASCYYNLQKILGYNIIKNHADFRLMSNRVLRKLKDTPYENIYLRGIVPSLNFAGTCIYYTGQKRSNGKSKYSLTKMLKLAYSGLKINNHKNTKNNSLKPIVYDAII